MLGAGVTAGGFCFTMEMEERDGFKTDRHYNQARICLEKRFASKTVFESGAQD